MYDFIHRNKRILQIILAVLIVPPFALFGVDWYFRGNDAGGRAGARGRHADQPAGVQPTRCAIRRTVCDK